MKIVENTDIIDPPPQNPKVMLNHPQVMEIYLKDRTEGNCRKSGRSNHVSQDFRSIQPSSSH